MSHHSGRNGIYTECYFGRWSIDWCDDRSTGVMHHAWEVKEWLGRKGNQLMINWFVVFHSNKPRFLFEWAHDKMTAKINFKCFCFVVFKGFFFWLEYIFVTGLCFQHRVPYYGLFKGRFGFPITKLINYMHIWSACLNLKYFKKIII
jgi:hypothetical protein